MLGKVFKRLKGSLSGASDSVLAASDEKVMKAIVAAMCLVAYANKVCSNAEVDKVNAMIKSQPQLKEFYNEPARLFDSYCDQMEASYAMAKADLHNVIAKILGDEINAPRVLMAGIEVAFVDASEDIEELSVAPEEERALEEIAQTLDIRLGKYL